MADMSDIDKRIERLESAIASGHQRVTYKDRTVEYRSIDEMERVLERLKVQRDGKKTRRTNPRYDRGL